MTLPHPRYQGVWLPMVSPYKDGDLDEASVRRMVARYAGQVDGIILAATTGEGLALSRDEVRRLADWTAEELEAAGKGAPVLIGLGGAVTANVVEAVRAAEDLPADGLLIACPYYVRPTQQGLRLHFEAIAEATTRDILVYNIPYRTGVNMANDTLLRLAERPNIVGVKDCCADPGQSRDLIARKPDGFSVLCGEDAGFLFALRQGADGGVVASAHLRPEMFRDIHRLARDARWDEAGRLWAEVAAIPDLLFAEPSPSALKHALWRTGLIDTPDLRLPMIPPSAELAGRVEAFLA
ncbi:4-hydroxy-tetrahydrodipicolinate synthase [Phenylobacterium sp.]|uniref:4-hydroxy-tetrahydrodipicolinate synthase family protein n=1 Tax=Phenylobacterium sp. TaxID=1871053 RepID=UPI00286E6111|nr:4-hydroxy-tetrahydrodipicolinate synthase [Phenylobacterium sp.]